MKVGVVGTGEMGLAMTGHLIDKGFEVTAYDIDAARLVTAGERGANIASGLEDIATKAEVFILVVATDDQVRDVTRVLADHAGEGAIIVTAATNAPDRMRENGEIAATGGKRFIDAPVVYGAAGARAGNLLSLCGGDAADVEAVRPVLMAYSRDVLHIGPLGAGQMAKACNNLMHWVHCVANFETLALAKRYGLDAQRMREVLLECPAQNGTLSRWDNTRFTWQEKDMDLTMEMAQKAGLMLPLAGQVDQLVKKLSAADVKALLYGEEASYLGQRISPLPPAEGGLGA